MVERSRVWFSASERAELWGRWRGGQCIADIARALERRNKSGVYRILAADGGIAPRARRRAARALRLEEREEISRGMRVLLTAAIAIVLGAGLVYVPWQYRHTLNSVPRIHDITTDTDNPPAFVAALPARAAEKSNSTTYEGPEVARQQKAAYPDIVPLKVALPQDEAFKRALDAARAMPGWTVVASDPASGRIEANDTSRWFRFTDDVVIRVAPDGAGSRVDVRSESRQGRSDFGVNAKRVRAYLAALRSRLG